MLNEIFQRILKNLLELRRIKREGAEAIRKIRLNENFSEKYKADMERKINNDTMQKLAALYEETSVALDGLRESMTAKRKSIDLSSVKLQNVLQIVNMANGKEMSQPLQDHLVEQLADDPGALEILLPMFHNAGMIFAAQAAEEKLSIASNNANFADVIDDAIYYEVRQAAPEGGIDRAINHMYAFAHANGLEATGEMEFTAGII